MEQLRIAGHDGAQYLLNHSFMETPDLLSASPGLCMTRSEGVLAPYSTVCCVLFFFGGP